MSSEEKNRWLPVLGIAGALAAWGVLLAVGAWLAPSDPGAARDFRKLWMVAAMVAGFLLLWAGVLWASARRVRQKKASPEGGEIARATSLDRAQDGSE